MNCKDKIIKAIADKSSDEICGKVIRSLQRMKDESMLSNSDNLDSVWDEICVQVQDEDSFYWDSYLLTIRMIIRSEVKKLQIEIRQAIWLQTEEGFWWDEEADNEYEKDKINHIGKDITEYILDIVLLKAGDWTNKRIEKYLYRG